MNKVIWCNIFNIPKPEELTEFPHILDMEYEQKRGIGKVLVWAIQRMALPLTVIRRLQ